MSRTSHQNKNSNFFIKGIRHALLIAVLFIYLLIPFKQQFLETVHLIDHFSQHEQAMHSHDHSHGEADHHHGYMAFVSTDNQGAGSEHPIPTELVNYQFQIPLPSTGFSISKHIPLVTNKMLQMLFVPVLNGPFFEVPQPPP